VAEREDERRFPAVRVAVDYSLVHVLAQALTLEEAAPRILASIGGTLGWEIGVLWEVEGRGRLLRCVDVWLAHPDRVKGFEEATRSVSFAPGLGLPGRVWASGEPAWIGDVTRDGNFPRAHAAAEASMGGGVAFPIRGGGPVLGVMEFFAPEMQDPEPRLLEMMAVAGAQVGQFMERKLADEEIRHSEALKSAILESAIDCLIAIDHEGKVLEFNPAAERTFGYRRDEVIGREMAELIIPPHLRDRHRRGLGRVVAGGEGPVLGKRIELSAMHANGSEFPVELTVSRIADEDPPVFTGYIRDITERRRNEDALRFLVEASAALDATLELDTILQNLADITVPYLADGCMVDVLEEGRWIRRVAVAAADASYKPILEELRRHRISLDGPHPIASVMRKGRTEIVHDIDDSFRREISEDDDYFEALRRWPARSIVIAPIKTRGRLHGTMSLSSFRPERRYGLEQISVIEELANRAANAVENARLFEERSRIARSLEQSLLPPQLPVVPGVELAARFRPAGGGGEVGGDFYDVFYAGDPGWAIVMGDVSGRGVDAASITVLARHTIRAAAVQEAKPARMLSIVNEALRTQLEGLRFCSATLALLRTDGAGVTLTLASAGHPLPLLLHGNGEVNAIGRPGTVLGVVSEPDLNDEEVRLEFGDTVVFYTDGVTDMRPDGREFRPEDLSELVASCIEMDALTTAEHIDRSVSDADRDGPRDDAAILVAKVTGELGSGPPKSS
jgi:PAS domain S-box-containing protein